MDSSEGEIVPGVGVPPIEIGADINEARQAFGHAATVEEWEEGFSACWPSLGITATGGADKRIELITFHLFLNSDWGVRPCRMRTADGLGRGSKATDVVATLGQPIAKEGFEGRTWVYPGLAVRLLAKRDELETLTIGRPQRPTLSDPWPDSDESLKVDAFVQRLIEAVEHLSTPGLGVLVEEVGEEAIAQLEQSLGLRLPPSFRGLLIKHGVVGLQAPDQVHRKFFPLERLGGTEPTYELYEEDEPRMVAIENTLFFAFQHDDAVENYVGFDKLSVNDQGEMTVVRYWHDEPFSPAHAPHTKQAYGFAAYLEDQFRDFCEDLPELGKLLGA